MGVERMRRVFVAAVMTALSPGVLWAQSGAVEKPRMVIIDQDAAWAETFLELVRASRLVRSGRRALVARPRPAF